MDAKDIAANINFRGVIEAPHDDFEIHGISMGYGGTPLGIWTVRDEGGALYARATAENGVSFPVTRPPEETPVILTAHDLGGLWAQRVLVPTSPVTYPMVQRLPQARFLLVGSRAEYDPEFGAEDNAFVIAPNGDIVTKGCLGDGIQDVQADLDGNIWTTYFDEGIGGNFGWGDGFGENSVEPIGAKCLIRWNSNLEEQWHIPDYESLINYFGDEHRDKCWVSEIYTLNVSEYSVDFSSYPFRAWLSLRGEQLVLHPMHEDLKYHGFYLATYYDIACFFGSFADGSNWIIADCKNGGWKELLRCQLDIPHEKDVGIMSIAQRGSKLHFFLEDCSWYTFDLTDVI